MEGKVYVVGDHVDTDAIIPARYLNTSDTVELAKHAMEDLRPQEIPFLEDGSCDYKIIVAGENFGCGSSREQAVLALEGAGIRAIVAKSFARIIFRNCVNRATIIPVELDEIPAMKTGDIAVVNFAPIPTFEYDGQVYKGLSLEGPPYDIMAVGGLVNYTREKLQ